MAPKVLLYIIGFMGSGKSTLAKLAAEKWNCPFYNTDKILEEEHISAEELLRDPLKFRLREAKIVARLSSLSRGIIDLGGGAIENLNTRKLLLGRPVIFLDPGVDICWQRVQADDCYRPLAVSYPTFVALYQKRLPLYLGVCRWHFTEPQLPRQLLRRLERIIPKN